MDGESFLRNGKPHRILSGALHYFRILPELWEDRLSKCRAMGLNTIETYVAWNLHEPRKGVFDFRGRNDLGAFIDQAAGLGLDVILRPGPYICAEWDLGGFPAWLLADRNLRLRCMDAPYLAHVASYLDRLVPQFRSRLASQGGPIIAVQVENEYGSYGNDRRYLEWLEAALRERGVDSLLFTSDGPEDFMLQGGTLPHLLKTVNFGTKAAERFAQLRKYQREGPLMCMEFWNGWFEHWGHEHQHRSPEHAAAELDSLLATGASVNIYMVHGGTNFGLMNGANRLEDYRSTTTSYDYGAPLDEMGNPTRKYALFRDILARHGAAVEEIPATTQAQALGRVVVSASFPFLPRLDSFVPPISSVAPCAMEELGENAAWILYRTHVSGPRSSGKLFIQDVHDLAFIYLEGKFVAKVHRNDRQTGVAIEIPPQGARLEILVENLGRVNYGPWLHDRKGITHGVRFNNQFLFHWEILPFGPVLPGNLPWQKPAAGRGNPMVHRAELFLSEPADTWLQIEHGVRGAVWVNGFCLGRYWEIGPQQTLCLPAPLLDRGRNTFVFLELEAGDIPDVVLCDQPFPENCNSNHLCEITSSSH